MFLFSDSSKTRRHCRQSHLRDTEGWPGYPGITEDATLLYTSSLEQSPNTITNVGQRRDAIILTSYTPIQVFRSLTCSSHDSLRSWRNQAKTKVTEYYYLSPLAKKKKAIGTYIAKRGWEIRPCASLNDLNLPELGNYILGTWENLQISCWTILALWRITENGRGARKLEAGKCHCCFWKEESRLSSRYKLES